MKLYRYSNNGSDSCNIIEMRDHDDGNVTVFLHEFEVIKETKCGGWIQPWGQPKNRFVLFDTYKQYASKTVAEAKTSFIARKKRQIKILSSQLQDAKDSLLAIEVEPRNPDTYFSGTFEY